MMALMEKLVLSQIWRVVILPILHGTNISSSLDRKVSFVNINYSYRNHTPKILAEILGHEFGFHAIPFSNDSKKDHNAAGWNPVNGDPNLGYVSGGLAEMLRNQINRVNVLNMGVRLGISSISRSISKVSNIGISSAVRGPSKYSMIWH